MFGESSKYLKFGSVTLLILLAIAYLTYTGVQESKSYYVTIKELRGMGDSAYTRRLRVAGNVQPGSIKRAGTKVDFVMVENGLLLNVAYSGTEARPILSKTIRKRWPRAALGTTASSTRSNSRRSALPSTRHSRNVLLRMSRRRT